jgi:uncharacterized protein YecT (DUF1311 family)
LRHLAKPSYAVPDDNEVMIMRWGRLITAGLVAVWAAPAMADPGYEDCMERAKKDADYRKCGDALLQRRESVLVGELKTRAATLEPKTKALFTSDQRLWMAWKDKSCGAWQSGDFDSTASLTQFYACREKVIDARISYLTGLSQYGTDD